VTTTRARTLAASATSILTMIYEEDRPLVDLWAQTLVGAGVEETELRRYRSYEVDWYGLTCGVLFARRDFGLARDGGRMVARAKYRKDRKEQLWTFRIVGGQLVVHREGGAVPGRMSVERMMACCLDVVIGE